VNRLFKIVFFALFVKPLVFVGLGLNIRGRKNLPLEGPAVIAANHNSHLDTLVLMSLFPLSLVHKVRPVAAADYFMKNRLLAWFSLRIIGIIPLDRSGKSKLEGLFKDCHGALDAGDILLIFPEGSRGNPEEFSRLKKGIYYLINERSDTLVSPVILHGLGRALPKGEALFVPFNCDVIIDGPIEEYDDSSEFMGELLQRYTELSSYCVTRNSE
jgi:1-acyl-sn-glycerol-3-phosphate acyltransferase